MIISKNVTLEELESMQDGEDVLITKDVALNKEMLFAVFSHFKKSHISVLSGYDKNQSYSSFETTLYSEDELHVLLENAEFVNKTFNKQLSFDAGYNKIERGVDTSRLINQIADEVNSLRVDGRPLSPFEKFVYVYHFASNRIYKDEPDYQNESYSRNLLSCLFNGHIVCVGFSNILTTILNKVGVPTSSANVVNSNENKLAGKHLANYVRIDDDIYDIHGIYYADASADAATSLGFEFGNNSFNKALRRISDIHIFNPGTILDATTSKSEKITAPIERQLKPAPTIMSKLFPEISSGLSQGQMIESYIPYFVQTHNLKKGLKNKIHLISKFSKEDMLEKYIHSVLNFEEFYSNHKKPDFDKFLTDAFSKLKFVGLSNEEIIGRFQSMIQSPESKAHIEAFFNKKFKFMKALNSTFFVNKELEAFSNILKQLPERLKSLESVSVLQNKNQCALELLTLLSNDVIGEKLYKSIKPNQQIDATILHLLNNGVSLQEIESLLNESAYSFDMAEGFIKTDKTISKKVGLDESEFYLGYDEQNIDFIFNEPYEDLFESLSQNAPFVEQEKFKSAILKIFLAQGHKKEKASELTAQMLRHTNIENPKENQKKFDD